MDIDLYRASTFGDGLIDVPNIRKDIRDAVVEDFDGIDAVLHLAALSNDPLGSINPELTLDINYKGAVRVARLAKEAGVRGFVFSSSCSVYGTGGQDTKIESSELYPVPSYGESKVYAERDIFRMAEENFAPTHLRNATAYGVSPRLRFDLVLNKPCRLGLYDWEGTPESDGSAWRPIVHVEDISRAFVAVLNRSGERSEPSLQHWSTRRELSRSPDRRDRARCGTQFGSAICRRRLG